MGISFNNNDYGITRKEWHAIKKELKAADKADDSFKLSRSDYKDMKASIKAGNLGDYLDKYGTNIRNAMGLSLTGKVDGTEDIKAAQQIVNDVTFGEVKTDKEKVLRYIKVANFERQEKDLTENYAPAADSLEKIASENLADAKLAKASDPFKFAYANVGETKVAASVENFENIFDNIA